MAGHSLVPLGLLCLTLGGCGHVAASAVQGTDITAEALPIAGGAADVVSADVNGDGFSDLVVAVLRSPPRTRGGVWIFWNPGNDQVPPSSWRHDELSPDHDYARVAVGDLDGDGTMDIAAITFATGGGVLRWWLGEKHWADQPTSGSLSIDGTQLADTKNALHPSLPCGKISITHQHLSSLALGDVDADGLLDVAVSTYVDGNQGAPLYLMTALPGRGHQDWGYQMAPSWGRCGDAALRIRLSDLDGDGHLDISTSAYGITVPECAGDCAPAVWEWGEWWSLAGDPAKATVAGLRVDVAGTGLPATPPSWRAFDHDIIGTGAHARMAVALNAHQCVTDDCWNTAARGGVVLVVENDHVLWTSQGAQKTREAGSTQDSLLPFGLAFTGKLESPDLLVGFRWSSLSAESPCADSKRGGCAGPMLWAGDGQAAWSQATQFNVATVVSPILGSAAVSVGPTCFDSSTRVLTLANATVTAIERVVSGQSGAPLAYSWVPGSRQVVLRRDQPHEPACVIYRALVQPGAAAVDYFQGLLFLSRGNFQAQPRQEKTR
jgi:hypothetical protein